MKAKISDIYNYAKSHDQKLFGNISAFPFMAGYDANATAFDYLFNKKYSSFLYLTEFDKTATLQNVYDDFTTAINAHFVFNAKRYNELYRVETLAANAYDVVNNYDLTESATRTTSGTNSVQRSAHTDNETLGAVSNSDTYGAREDTTTVNNGIQETTTKKDIAGFNSDHFVDSNKESTTIEPNTSGGTSTKGSQTDTHTEAGRTNSMAYGAQTESGTNSGSETTTLRRFGNIGVATAADIIGGHITLWDNFSFYNIIFKEIAKEFMLIDDDYIISGGGSGAFSESEVAEIMQSLNEIKAQINTSTATIRNDISNVEIDDTAIIAAVNNAKNDLKLDISNLSASLLNTKNDLKLDISNLSASMLLAENRIKANDNANTAAIQSDITGVVTNGY